MTMSIHWTHGRDETGEAATAGAGRTARRIVKSILVAGGLFAFMLAIIAIRVVIYLPHLR